MAGFTGPVTQTELQLVQPRVEPDRLTQQVVDNLSADVAIRVSLWPLPVHDETDTLPSLAARTARLSSLGLYQPVLVCFGGLYIDRCRGFPGVRTQEIVQKIGPDGIIRLLGNEEERSATWLVILAFCQPGQAPRVFQREFRGEILRQRMGHSDFIDSVFTTRGNECVVRADANPVREVIRQACEAFLDWWHREGRPALTSP